MVLIWGHKGYSQFLGIIVQECPSCRLMSPFVVYQQGRKFTLYFIPTFSYSKKQVAICTSCKNAFEIPNDRKAHIESMLMSEEEFKSKVNQFAYEARKQIAETETKKCPYCAETIKAEATFCRFCQRDLTETPVRKKLSARSKSISTRKSRKKKKTSRK